MFKPQINQYPLLAKELSNIVIHHEIEQGTQEWHALRCGRFTGTSCAKILGTKAAKEAHIYDKACEISIGTKSDSDENINGIHINRGKLYEDPARNAYIKYNAELLLDDPVTVPGFVASGEYIGYSPDGFVGNDGLIEIKIPDSNNYFRQALEIKNKGIAAIPKDYYLQMQFGLLVCQKQWVDYVIYSPKHEISGKALFVQKVLPDDKIQEEICDALESAITQMQKLIEEYKDL